MDLLKLLKEMIFVGITLSLLGLVVSYIGDVINGKKIEFWPEHAWSMLVGTAVTGGLYHFIFELTGLNEFYVKQYYPLLM